MKVRRILLVITSFLGVALLGAVLLRMDEAAGDLAASNALVASTGIRTKLLLASAALVDERRAGDEALRTGGSHGALALTATRADGLLEDAEKLLGRSPAGPARQIDEARDALAATRAHLQAALADRGDVARAENAWFIGTTAAIDRIDSVRTALLRAQDLPTPGLRADAQMRQYASMLRESLSRNRLLLGPDAPDGMRQDAGENAGRARAASELLVRLDDPALLGPDVARHVDSLMETLESEVLPAQAIAIGAGRTPAAQTSVSFPTAEEHALAKIDALQQALIAMSLSRLEAIRRSAERRLVVWALLCGAGIAAVVASALVVRNMVVRPLEALARATLRLADDDVDAEPPRIGRSDEIAEMADALRVFRANVLRRRQLERDQLAMHARLRDAHRRLREDLDAAAAVQTSLLPKPGSHSGILNHGFYRPSAVIAGDTFDVVAGTGGSLRFFQIDVAGHGAAAALVSVASHYALSQALRRLSPDEALGSLVEHMNRAWPEELPYFTIVLGEIDPGTGRGGIVQAGHPPPLIVRKDGTVETIGDGGFPVGLFEDAEYEIVAFGMAPGERLIVYTDGVTETENGAGEQFSQARLERIAGRSIGKPPSDLVSEIETELLAWRSVSSFDDDVTVLVLDREAT